MKLCREFKFDASHHLPLHKGKCKRLHGHTYKLEVIIAGQPNNEGMVLDFAELKKIVQENIIEHLDHSNLNDLFDNPTAENIATWIFKELESKLNIHSIKLWEGEGSWTMIEK